MEIEYDYQPRDLEAWWQYYSRHSSPHRFSYWISVLLIGGGAAWVGTRIGLTFSLSSATVAIVAVVGGLVGWSLAAASHRVWLRASAVAAGQGPAVEQQFGRHRLTLRPEGVLEQGPSASHTHAWGAIEGLSETADHMFLVVGGGFAYAIPKRALQRESAAAFRTQVASYLSEEGRRRTRG
jgi:hypothetical protein